MGERVGDLRARVAARVGVNYRYERNLVWLRFAGPARSLLRLEPPEAELVLYRRLSECRGEWGVERGNFVERSPTAAWL